VQSNFTLGCALEFNAFHCEAVNESTKLLFDNVKCATQ